MNGRPGSGSALQRPRLGSPSHNRPGSADGAKDGAHLLAVLKQAAGKEPAAALRELQRLHAQLAGAAGSKALTSLESAWQQQGSASGGPGMPPMSTGGSMANATANAITSQQRELNQLTIQRQVSAPHPAARPQTNLALRA